MNETMRILILEDDPDDAYLIQSILRDHLSFQSTVAKSKAEYLSAIDSQEYDVILSDHRMHQFSSLEALKIRNERKITAPFILITGTVSEEFAVAIIKEGASDYILKDRLQRLPLAIKKSDSAEKTR